MKKVRKTVYLPHGASIVVVVRRYDPPDKKREICHGCGRIFKPRYRRNTRCPWCQRMSRVLLHQRHKARARARGVPKGFERHTCAECRWALKRGFTLETEERHDN